MKKILTTLALASLAMTGFAQAKQQYMRVRFTVPMTTFDEVKTDKEKNGTPVAQGMKDYYIYPNPQHQYLDFNVTTNPITFRSTTTRFDETKDFMLQQTRNTQDKDDDTSAQMPYKCDYIESITMYSIPVERVELIDSVPAKEVDSWTLDKEGKLTPQRVRVSEFTFNRLPRNVAELKTLIEPNGDGVRKHCHNPEFIVAAMYLVMPRFLDCSQDCRDMIDYLCGRFNATRKSSGNRRIGNTPWQDLCTGTFNGNFGKDANSTYWDHNKVYQWFDGAKPSNQYRPNGKDYGYDQGPYKVYVCREINPKEKTYYLIHHPYDQNLANRCWEDAFACPVKVAQTSEGFFFDDNPKKYFLRGKDQINPDL